MRRLAALALLAVASVACSDDSGAPQATASPTGPSTPAGASAQTNVRSGSATATVSGEEAFEIQLELATGDSQYNPPPAGFAFVFKDDADNLITIGGEAFEGSKKTAGTLAFGAVFNRSGRVIAHTDTAGGCDLTMKRSGKTVAGAFVCPDVEDGRYQVEGTFTVELV